MSGENGRTPGDEPQRADLETESEVLIAERPDPKEPALNIPVSLLILAGVCSVLHILLNEMFSTRYYNAVIANFSLIPLRMELALQAVDFGALATLVTHSFIHGSWMHLAFNMIWLVAFGAPLAYRLGFLRTVLFWIITAISAAVFHLMIYWGDPIPLIGASGAVSGFLGAAARFGFRRPQNARAGFTQTLPPPIWALRQRGVLGFLVLWVVLNFVTGMGWLGGPSNIAWEAHIGGLLAGFLLIGLIDRQPKYGLV